ncbi:hypothetical protein JRQ81_006477 [Phrynocephalus forsythii]|uniref:ubiquitinyl hydrolase 1 n=1 Tax=Phrynocephalus forsythii TaxID=171643 RepID=A0A9Q1AUN3_9SAUR|nr:hypothetical protein JRQ81_006477 [Phrynocephalus forsythii]
MAHTEVSELKPLLGMPLRPGEFWYLINSRWFKQWKKYVGFDSWDRYNVGEPKLFPGPIDNSGLFANSETQILKEYLIDEVDYVLVPTEVWNKLVNWYGCVEGQKPIVRKVVECGVYVKYCKVEVYLFELKLCQNNDPNNLISCYFSKADTIDTIGKEMRKLFNIPDGKEIRLWRRYMSNASIYELLSKLDSTIEDSGLYQRQVVVIEKVQLKKDHQHHPRQCRRSWMPVQGCTKAEGSQVHAISQKSKVTSRVETVVTDVTRSDQGAVTCTVSTSVRGWALRTRAAQLKIPADGMGLE